MKVLVTGGSGQLSSYLFEELEKEHEARGVDLREPVFDSAKGKVDIADIRDAEAMLDICKGADAIVHTAAQVSVQRSTEDPAFDVETNVLGTVRTLKAARDAGVAKFIFISSAAVYGDSLCAGGRRTSCRPSVHIRLEQALGRIFRSCLRLIVRDEMGHSAAVQLLFSPRRSEGPYSGVITKFTQNAASGLPLRIEGDGSQTQDFLHAADVARLVRLTLESKRDGLTLNGGSGQATSILDLAKTVKKVCPRPVNIEHVAPRPRT